MADIWYFIAGLISMMSPCVYISAHGQHLQHPATPLMLSSCCIHRVFRHTWQPDNTRHSRCLESLWSPCCCMVSHHHIQLLHHSCMAYNLRLRSRHCSRHCSRRRSQVFDHMGDSQRPHMAYNHMGYLGAAVLQISSNYSNGK